MIAKTIEQINREFAQSNIPAKTYEAAALPSFAAPEFAPARFHQDGEDGGRDKRKNAKLMMDAVLYAAVFIILATALVLHGNKNGIQIFGYSGFNVVSSSMHSEIPEGSLVLAKKTDPNEINVGDVITFQNSDNLFVTHKVVNIIENYNDGSDKGFRTQGLENSEPDRDIVYADQIVGVVEYTVPGLGSALAAVSEYIWFVVLISIVILAIITLSARYGKRDRGE